jgi:putative Holliday junction resolvase
MPTKTTNVLALDVGDRRIGVAIAGSIARLANPLTVLANDETLWHELSRLLAAEHIGMLVVGLPRSLSGEDTAQTKIVRSFVSQLKTKTDIPVTLQDEALTSRQAEAELRARGKKFAKGDIDALAAVYILDDYLTSLGTIEGTER